MTAPARPEYRAPRHRPDADRSRCRSSATRTGSSPPPATRSASWSRPTIRAIGRNSSGSSTATRIPAVPASSRSSFRRPSTVSARARITTSGAAPTRRSRSTTRSPTGGFTFTAFISPTLPGRGEQVLLSRGDPFHAGGLAVGLDETGALELVVGGRGEGDTADAPHRFGTGAPMRRWEWYFVAVAIGPNGDRPLAAGRPPLAGRRRRTRLARSSSTSCRRRTRVRCCWRRHGQPTGGPRTTSTGGSTGRGPSGGRCRARRCCASSRRRTTSTPFGADLLRRVGLLGRHRHATASPIGPRPATTVASSTCPRAA